MADDGGIISEMHPNDAEHYALERWKAAAIITPEPIRFRAADSEKPRRGVKRSHPAQLPGGRRRFIQELFSRDGIGTQVRSESSEQTRRANINDIGGILELIRPAGTTGHSGAPLPRTAGNEIDKFTIY